VLLQAVQFIFCQHNGSFVQGTLPERVAHNAVQARRTAVNANNRADC